LFIILCAQFQLEKIYGISIDKVKEGIQKFELSKNRMEIINKNGITIINDCYNANFDSMKASIGSLAKMEGKRKIAVLGDMLELGDYSKSLHYNVGLEVVKNNIDVLVTVGTEAKNIANAAKAEGMNSDDIHEFENNKDAVNALKSILSDGDVVLIKASNGMKFIEIVNELKS